MDLNLKKAKLLLSYTTNIYSVHIIPKTDNKFHYFYPKRFKNSKTKEKHKIR